MPYKYKSKTYRKKKSYAKKGAKRGSIYGAAAGQLWKDVKFLKDMINVERKVFDLDATGGGSVTNTGTVAWMSGITTGTGFNQRTGMVVKAASISVRGTCEVNTAATTPTQFRVILFINKGLNQNALPAVTDILQSTGISANAGPFMPYSLANVGDFSVLYDRKFTLDLVQRNQININIRAKLGHHIRWETSGDLQTNAEAGHIYMLTISDQSTNAPTFQWYSRLRFIDN